MTRESDRPERTLLQIVFDLPHDGSGWPPVRTEGVWATPYEVEGTYRIESTPWFVRGVAQGDIVRATPTGEPASAVYEETVRWSGNLTLRVRPADDGPLQGSMPAVLNLFRTMAVVGEAVSHHGIVALTVPGYAPMEHVKHLLHRGEADGWWTFEEGCVDAKWLDLDVVLPAGSDAARD